MLPKFSVRKPYTVFVAVIVVIMFGVVSFTRMVPDLFPKIELPYVAVITTYPGASPQTVESEVTAPLEQQLSTLENLKSVTSTSSGSSSLIFLEFEQDTELDTVSVDIRDKAALVSGSWDDAISSPVIMKINPSMIPVNVSAVSVKGSDISETSRLLDEEILRKLEGTDGVASVTSAGMIENSVRITVSDEKVNAVNEKITGAVSGSLADAESTINKQLADAEKSLAALEAGKEQIKNSQDTLAENRDSITGLLTSLKTLTTSKEGLEAANGAIYDSIAAAMPEASEEVIEAAAMKNETYAENAASIAKAESAISAVLDQVKPMRSVFEGLGIDVSTLGTLDGVTKAEETLNVSLQKQENRLNNAMAEAAGSEALLKAANMQLESSLAQLDSQGASAAESASSVSSYLTVSGISQLITAQNFQMPAGYVSDDGKDVLVTVGDMLDSVDALENLVILNMGIDGVDPVKLSDVADIEYITTGTDNYAKINDEDGIMLVFSKQSDYATAEVSENIKARFDELEKEYDGLSFSVLSDQGDYIHMAISSVLNSLVTGGILAIIVLFIFLRDMKPTLITAVSIPISITFAIVLMYFSGIQLNIISLAGLSVGIGMLVDNSIVVIENIYRLRSHGCSRKEAAIKGAAGVSAAITASTLTTICVFAPIVFVEGLTKVIFKDMALTVTYSLVASLLVALTVVPALGQLTLRNIRENSMLGENSRFIAWYKSFMEKVLHRKAVVIGITLILLAATCAGALSRGFEYMPAMALPQISATVELDEKTDREDAFEFYDEIASAVSEVDGVNTVGAMLSSSMSLMSAGSSSGSDYTSAMFYILMDEDKLDNGKEVEEIIYTLCEEEGAESTASSTMDMNQLMGSSGITINVTADDLDDLRDAAVSIQDELSTIEGLSDVSDVNEDSTDQIIVTVDRNKAMASGLTVAQVYSAISEKLSDGTAATSITYNGKDTDVTVTAKDEALTADTLSDLAIDSAQSSGDSVKLSDIASVERSRTLDTISRLNQNRTLTVSAAVDDGYNVTKQTALAQDAVDALELPDGVQVEFAGENEQIMDALNQLLLMLILAVVLIYLVMVAQFQSLLSPFIVMFTVPLAVTGAMAALLITGNTVSVVAMVGIIMLVGVIVNNAIVLIDYINQRRAEGVPKREAIISAGAVRMRPVLMTAITTILGLFPMAVGMGQGAEMIKPVAIVCIGGLIYGTFMTLIVIPVMYDILGKKDIQE